MSSFGGGVTQHLCRAIAVLPGSVIFLSASPVGVIAGQPDSKHLVAVTDQEINGPVGLGVVGEDRAKEHVLSGAFRAAQLQGGELLAQEDEQAFRQVIALLAPVLVFPEDRA